MLKEKTAGIFFIMFNNFLYYCMKKKDFSFKISNREGKRILPHYQVNLSIRHIVNFFLSVEHLNEIFKVSENYWLKLFQLH